jgi:uncharacterized protein
LPKGRVHLLDVNALLALLDQAHVHNQVITEWFDTPGLKWALCPFTEAGVVRFFTRPKTGELSIEQATAMLKRLKKEPGYHYQPITADWQTLTEPFFKRVHGHNQVTDAYLLGLAVKERLVLVTFDKAILQLAGEYNSHVLLLTTQ